MNERMTILAAGLIIGLMIGVTIGFNIEIEVVHIEKIHVSISEGNKDTLMTYTKTSYPFFVLKHMPFYSEYEGMVLMFKELFFENGTEIQIQSIEYRISKDSLRSNNNTSFINLLEHVVMVELK